VDDFNYERLKHLKIHDTGSSLQVRFLNKFTKKQGQISLAKIILLTTRPMIDHVDRNYLNNQINNLRPCNYGDNSYNKTKYRNNISGFIGVSWNKKLKKWSAYASYKNTKIHLGYFNTAEEAAKVRDKAAKELFGKFAVLNFPE
jgi:hypothetical protein